MSGVNLGRDIKFCSKQGASLEDASSKGLSGFSNFESVNCFDRVPILGLVKMLCTVVGV